MDTLIFFSGPLGYHIYDFLKWRKEAPENRSFMKYALIDVPSLKRANVWEFLFVPVWLVGYIALRYFEVI
ncbi:MAG: hypothetical protein AAGE89_04690 [Pseudomonadota bacterium]